MYPTAINDRPRMKQGDDSEEVYTTVIGSDDRVATIK